MAARYRVALFDVDGTLVSFKTHAMSASTTRALAAMKANGVTPVVCTGRLASQVPAEVSALIEDVIAINGQHCVLGGEVVRSVPLDPGDVRAVVEQVDAGLYQVLVMLADRAFASADTPAVREIMERVHIHYPVDDVHLALSTPVYQICAIVPPEREHLILERTRTITTTRWTDLFCDLVPRAGGKDYGVRAVLEWMGARPEEAIAFGDGENDLPMFEACGTSVAMANAYPTVLDRATYVTTSVDEDGIWNAAVHFGLI